MKPIQSGDTCQVIQGLGRSKSPNLGLTVTVVSLQGEHSQHGRVFRCKGVGVVQLGDGGIFREVAKTRGGESRRGGAGEIPHEQGQ